MNLLEITEFSLWSQKWNLIWSGWIISPICLAIIYRRIDPKWMTESNSWNLPWLHFHISRAIKCLWCAQALTQLAKSSRQVKGQQRRYILKVQKNLIFKKSSTKFCHITFTRFSSMKQLFNMHQVNSSKTVFCRKKSSFGISSLTGAWQKSLALVGHWALESWPHISVIGVQVFLISCCFPLIGWFFPLFYWSCF